MNAITASIRSLCGRRSTSNQPLPRSTEAAVTKESCDGSMTAAEDEGTTMNKLMISVALSCLALSGCGEGGSSGGGDSAARKQIRVVGSSTVYPFKIGRAHV